MEQNQSQNLSPMPEPQPLNQKHFKAFWPIVIIATLSAIIGGLIVFAAYNAGLDEELNSLLPGADKRLARQHKNVELQPMISKASENSADWQTYRNEEYGFEFEYPSGVQVGDKKQSINLGTYKDPVYGINIGGGVLVPLVLPHIKDSAKAIISQVKSYLNKPKSVGSGEIPPPDCQMQLIDNQNLKIEAIYCMGEGGPAYYVYIMGETEYFYDGYAGKVIDNEMANKIFSTFKFTK